MAGRVLFLGAFLVVALLGGVEPTGKILLLPSAIVPSHKLIFNRLAEELIRRNNTVVSWQVTLKPDTLPVPAGLDHRVVKVAVPEKYIQNMFLYENATVYNVIWDENVVEPARKAANWAMMRRVCEVMLESHKADFMKLVNEKFDVAVIDDLYNPCGLIWAGLTRTPFVYWSHTHMRTETAWSTQSPNMPSYIPVPGTGYTDDMDFWERTFNLISYVKTIYVHQRIILRPIDWLVAEHFPGSDIADAFYIERNASANFINTAAVYDFPRPFMPRVFFVGCLQCRKAEALSNEQPLTKFVDAASDKEGFVLFTTGFTVQWKRTPKRVVDTFVEAFREMPTIRFVWQYDGAPIANLPSNVFVAPWLPQQDLLGHAKCKGFVTHGGINSVQESLWHGVPIMGLPLYAEHRDYLLRATESRREAGFILDKAYVEKETIIKAIRKLLKTDKYKKGVKDLQELMQDVPYSELDHAAFWVEFIIRHGEIPFARSGADDLNILQYFLVDVILFLIAVTILICIFSWYAIKLSCRVCRAGCRRACGGGAAPAPTPSKSAKTKRTKAD